MQQKIKKTVTLDSTHNMKKNKKNRNKNIHKSEFSYSDCISK